MRSGLAGLMGNFLAIADRQRRRPRRGVDRMLLVQGLCVDARQGLANAVRTSRSRAGRGWNSNPEAWAMKSRAAAAPERDQPLSSALGTRGADNPPRVRRAG
jgi:hypothetical protein